ncbi:MAG: copper chaperone PCu(A)C [Burkholderiaceae bacterium]
MNTIFVGARLRLNRLSVTVLTTALVLGLAPWTGVSAQKFESETVVIDFPYSFPTPPGLSTGSVYFDAITAVGKASDRLTGASSPIASRVEIHRMKMDGDIMRMREVADVAIDQKAPVPFHKGAHDGYHLMLMQLNEPLTDGMSVPVTLEFENAGAIEVKVKVMPFGSHPEPGKMDHSGHSDHSDHSKHK